MTDCELLELAAKAAGIEKDDSPYNGGGFGNDGFDCVGNMVLDWHNNKRWNPLTDDGDALRLAVKLGMSVITGTYKVVCEWVPQEDGGNISTFEQYGTDHYAATRRAIVRAAAEIGKAMT